MKTDMQMRAPRLWTATAIVFVASACMMTLELVAGRIVAPYVGVSLYTWTTIIGIILAGMSLGNYIGGRLADRWASHRLLGLLFLLGGLTCVGVLLVDVLGTRLPNAWPIVLRIIILVTALFFIPATLLGTISPVVVSLSVLDLSRTGSTVGRISAAGTVGSIVGTFATGFLLITWFGTHAIVWGVAVVLLVMAVGFFLFDLQMRGHGDCHRPRRGPDRRSHRSSHRPGLDKFSLHAGDQLLLHHRARG